MIIKKRKIKTINSVKNLMLKKNFISFLNITRSLSVMSGKPKLLVTRVPEEIPRQSLEMLKPQ